MEPHIERLLQKEDLSIIISLPDNKEELAQAAIEAGADALKFHIYAHHHATGNKFKGPEHYEHLFKQVRQDFAGPIGVVIGDDIDQVRTVSTQVLKNYGFNYFSLYGKDVDSTILQQNDLAKTVAVDYQFNPHHVKAIESLGVDAVELSIVRKEDYGKSLDFLDIVTYQTYRDHTSLPLIVPSQKKLIPEDLITFREIGINAVMLGAVTIGNTADSIYETVLAFRKQKETIA
ncbi:hypothetical protein [Salirhabdus salicampi]|uniref:hypothetical protein n=1 Tax=Salirhabdus salicampi TaxID=476102 RepID=UPI0020C587CF|nr:hypothetical protein [Salirhabdus salicampi]MCP8615907.1 hypothetical protein [Salirhabdus salicampi]